MPNSIFDNTVTNRIQRLKQVKRASIANHFYKKHPEYAGFPEEARVAIEDIASELGPDFLDKFPAMKQSLDNGDFLGASNKFKQEMSQYAKQSAPKTSGLGMQSPQIFQPENIVKNDGFHYDPNNPNMNHQLFRDLQKSRTLSRFREPTISPKAI